SFPQTREIRLKRAGLKSGKTSRQEYEAFIKEKIGELIKFQEGIGLDVLVHGEFERTDMVEFFAQKLDGIVTTKNGWIISYGTRGYRPPIIYGDISRPYPLTLRDINFAQSLTKKPVKGMLTGPVTIVAWSFLREDIPVWEVAYQIGLCLQDEIKDYEKNGIKIIQVDEPAFREIAPIKKSNWKQYFDWATKSFRLLSKCRPQTQIHTHMCYSEFGEILGYISQMDFDVITIEASRSKGDIMKYFKDMNFDRQIGLGVWDIHSSATPDISDMRKIIEGALRAFPPENFWINPDCGLKTRAWQETTAALKNLTALAKELRKETEECRKLN
ncbi:MAG: 5-methyltetrahydropteroyltriglutamate--homocysteine S-methyltransferase, partial [Candidatus Omnitrophota bacterium]|nr:5-methyltetrahydropteroyltriglutamate--homocysteine S-methyltransferase [Candidatus Omnitrophota bacterium]